MRAISLPVFAKKHPSNYSPRLVRGFAFVFAKAVLVRKGRRTFGAHKKPSPVGEGGSRNVCKANLPRSEAK